MVFPTHVGVFLSLRRSATASYCLPHARGGVSPYRRLLDLLPQVFPTHVGVFPRWPSQNQQVTCLPHARGGVSKTI